MVFSYQRFQMIQRQIIFDGTKNRATGREIIAQSKKLKALNKEVFFRLFCRNDPILDGFKEKVLGEPVFIFYLDKMIPTPYVGGGDMSVYYFCWSEISQKWYSSLWRVNDTWNVVVGVLVDI